jgi:hypothetical protein
VAPLGNQAANRENKPHPNVWGVPSLLELRPSMAGSGSMVAIDRGYNDYAWYNQLTEKG